MATMSVTFEWDENAMGPFWFNEDNLKSCLFSDVHTQPELLSVTCSPVAVVNEPERTHAAFIDF